jgi:hypothetical protein
MIERVIGWYKEYRALGTRHEKLAVNYVALWLVAMIERSLKRLFPHAVWPHWVRLFYFQAEPSTTAPCQTTVNGTSHYLSGTQVILANFD